MLVEAQRDGSHREERITALERELEEGRARTASEVRALAALGAELQSLRVTARGQATKIRLNALREAAAVSEAARRLDVVDGDSADRLSRALERALDRLGESWEGEEVAKEAEGGTTVEAGTNGAHPGAAAPDPAASGRRVSVDVGPFRDFSQLASFEDAANAIGATGEISIRRFSEGRASIDVDLTEPVDLLRELEERCDLDFQVRARGDDEIILDLGE